MGLNGGNWGWNPHPQSNHNICIYIYIPMETLNIQGVLNEIWELGYINMKTKQITLPRFSVHMKGRIEPFCKFMIDYYNTHPDEERFEFFFTLYDGFREHSEPSEKPTFVKVLESEKSILEPYKGRGSAGEPGRFFHPVHLKDIFPYFCLPIVTWCKHYNDPHTLLIPDYEMISHNYISIKKEVDDVDISWENKIPKLFWRSNIHGLGYYAYDKEAMIGESGKKPRCQRKMLVDYSSSDGDGWLDASPSRSTKKEEMLKYKYLISCDGEVVNYSSNVWIMYSQSVMFRIKSHYIQWYFKDLKEWVHYIPIQPDLSDLKEKYEWALSHDEECKSIAMNGREFMKQLNYENILKNYRLE